MSRVRPPALRGVFAALLAVLIAFGGVAPAFAQAANDAAPLRFQSALEERRFNSLVSELRCVMCQNQSLADSNAQIAVDLRREVLDLIRQGRSDGEIREFLVSRYGEFVLYRPQFALRTWLLWLGPAVVLVAGAFAVVGIVRRSSRTAGPGRIEDDQEW